MSNKSTILNSLLNGKNYLNLNKETPLNCIPDKIPVPPEPPSKKSYSPSFNDLKVIIMENNTLTAEQRNNLIDQIRKLYN